MGSGSNLVRPLWIGRLGFNRRGEAAARYRRRGIPRRRAGEPAGEGQTGVLGVGLGRGLAGDDQHDMANPPVHLGRGFGARTEPATARGGAGGGACLRAVPGQRSGLRPN